MSLADTYNIRDADTVSLTDIGDAIDALCTDYDTVAVNNVQSTTSSSLTLITGAAVSIAVTGSQIVEVTGLVNLSAADAARYGAVALYRDTTGISQTYYCYIADAITSGHSVSVAISVIDEPPAGTYEYRMYYCRGSTSTTIYADSTYISVKTLQENE